MLSTYALVGAAGSDSGSPSAAPGTEPRSFIGCEATQDKRQMRGAWLTTVGNIDWPSKPGLSKEEQKKEMDKRLDEAVDLDLNTVFLHVRPTADAVYESDMEPWSKYLTGEQGGDPGYDPLEYAVEEAHKRGLELHAWFNPYRVGMNSDIEELADDHPVKENPEWLVTHGREGYFDPGNPDVRTWVTDVIMDVVERYDIDGVHFDDFFYPYPAENATFDDDESWEELVPMAPLDAEAENGQPQRDFLAADAATFEDYAAEGLLVEYTPADADALLTDVVDPEGYYVGTRIIPTVIAHNTSVIDAPPESWQELADPAYADQLVMPNPDVSGAAAYNAAVWSTTPELGDEWLAALAENNPVIADSNGPTSQAIATGAQPVGVVVDYLVRELAAQGSPIDVSYPSEGVPYVSQPAGIFADTDNEEAAKAFVDFLVSERGQQLAVEQSYLPVRSDVGTPEGAPTMDEIAILSPDLETVQNAQDAAVETFRDLFL